MKFVALHDQPAGTPGQLAQSPCIAVCRMDARNHLCEGCWRTLDEITAWGQLDEPGRQLVLQQVSLRKTKSTQALP